MLSAIEAFFSGRLYKYKDAVLPVYEFQLDKTV